MLAPFYWMVVTSLTPPEQFSMNWPLRMLPPWPPYVRNYPLALGEGGSAYLLGVTFLAMFRNSAIIAVLSVLGTLFSCSLGGYAFARLRFRFRDQLFVLLLATMIVPSQVTMIPTYLLIRALGWYNTWYPLWVPHFTGSAFGVFLMRQFYLTLPAALEDAARIDGASLFGIYRMIVLPLSGPVLATLGVMTFMGSWNNLLAPLLYINDVQKYTVPIGLAFFRGRWDVDWTGLMTVSIVSVIPIIAVFAFVQSYYVRGIALTGMHGEAL
ncbi:MAG: carbohydrate ABC transporter permease [Anaerolineae bacterium]|nr:carbohydrate ABC transporter permease [Anaerolineae bacterium]